MRGYDVGIAASAREGLRLARNRRIGVDRAGDGDRA